MAAAPVAAVGSSSAGGGGGGDRDRVYRAVAAGASAGEVRRLVEGCDEQRRLRAVNFKAGPNDETPLQAARRQKRGDLVGALVEAGAAVGGPLGSWETPLTVCISHGQVESVRALLRAGEDANEKVRWHPGGIYDGRVYDSCTPAHYCLSRAGAGRSPPDDHDKFGRPQIACLEVLLRDGADPNAPDSNGATPLFWLARYGAGLAEEDEAAARDALVAAGARTSGVFDGSEHSPLAEAAMHNNLRLARFLIEDAGAPVDELSPQWGRTALALCCQEAPDDADMPAFLLGHGADPEAPDDAGVTPLGQCVRYGRPGKARLLLDWGASADVIPWDGWTPLTMLCEQREDWLRDGRWPLALEILRGSSDEARRAVREYPSMGCYVSAADILVMDLPFSRTPAPYWEPADGGDEGEEGEAPPEEELPAAPGLPARPSPEDLRVQARRRWMISELLASGAPVARFSVGDTLPIVAARAQRRAAELARAKLCAGWRVQEALVGLALDHQELRGARAALEARRARLAAVELELCELGAGTTDSSGSEGESESEGEGEGEKGAATATTGE